MSISIHIPTPLQRFSGEQGEVEVQAATVGEALQSLVEQHGALQPHLYGSDGKLRSFVNLFLNDEDVRYMQQDETPLSDGDVLSIIPSIAGGVAR